VTVEANSTGKATAEATSAAVSLLSVGVSLAHATLSPSVLASLGGNIEADGDIAVVARHNVDANNLPVLDNKAYAEAWSPVTVGLLAGTGCDATATASAPVDSSVLSGASLQAEGDITILACAGNTAQGLADGLPWWGCSRSGESFEAVASGSTGAAMNGAVLHCRNLESRPFPGTAQFRNLRCGWWIARRRDRDRYRRHRVSRHRHSPRLGGTRKRHRTFSVLARRSRGRTRMRKGWRLEGWAPRWRVSLADATVSPVVSSYVSPNVSVKTGQYLRGAPTLTFVNAVNLTGAPS